MGSMETIISIQDKYIDTVRGGLLRWQHRPNGGHVSRIRRGAHKRAYTALWKLGYHDNTIKAIIQDAKDVLALEMAAQED